jgi:hypothetical protein
VLIKSADDKQGDIDALTALSTRSDLDAPTKRRIEHEIRTIRAGIAGERDAVYQIDFNDRMRKRAVIHDLRIEVDGRVAQIDHLLITQVLDMWVCESKHFAEGVGVNEHSEWVAFWNGKPHGIPSPVEQNRRHIAVLNDAFARGLVRLPKRLGVTLKPRVHSLILVSSSARVSRPKGRAAEQVDGLDTLVKVDQLATTIDKRGDEATALSSVGALARYISPAALEDFGKRLVALHRPIQIDWAARFGLSAASAVPPTVESAVVSPASPAPDQSCALCGSVVKPRVAAYCQANPQRFGGRILCWDCQRRTPRPDLIA